MKLLCPECHHPLDPTSLRCSLGHQYGQKDGIVVLLRESYREKLAAFEKALFEMRTIEQKRRVTDPGAYEKLPYGEAAEKDLEWRLRIYDLEILKTLLPADEMRTILEIGAWNGSLSNRLTEMGHAVTAIDYFGEEYEGLRAKKFYHHDWQTIQMDLNDLSILDMRFDIVIVNRCLQFFEDPLSYLDSLKGKLSAGGRLILLGLQFFKRPAQKIVQIRVAREKFRQDYGIDLFLNPTRGYLDFDDRDRLIKLGLKLRAYPQLKLANLKALLKPNNPQNFYGFFKLG